MNNSDSGEKWKVELDKRPDVVTAIKDIPHQIKAHTHFAAICVALLIAAGVIAGHDDAARWFGFAIAGYSAIANDSIQTIGTFIAANEKSPWWLMWLAMGGTALVTMIVSYEQEDGDISWGRLASKGFEETPVDISFLQLAAPVCLLVFTRARIPVSTSFLLLSSFVSKGSALVDMIVKSVIGYVIAYAGAMFLWCSFGRWMDRKMKESEPSKLWQPVQWIVTAFLWSLWLQQDMSNVAVFLPRKLNDTEFTVVAIYITVLLAALMYFRGDKIQSIVSERSGNIVDVRAATAVDILYTALLWVFKIQSKVPMSTTWVFMGLLAGREVALSLNGVGLNGVRVIHLISWDLIKVSLGFFMSILIAGIVNSTIFDAL